MSYSEQPGTPQPDSSGGRPLGVDQPQQAPPGSVPSQQMPLAARSSAFPTPYGPSTLPPRDRLGSWFQRVVGHAIDWLVAVVPTTLIGGVYNLAVSPENRVLLDDGTATAVSGNAASVVMSALLSLLTFGIIFWNRWWRAGRRGQSLGKQAMGLTMVRVSDGQVIGAWMAFLRDVAHILDTLLLMIGWLWPLWDNKRQTFADKIVKTLVFRV